MAYTAVPRTNDPPARTIDHGGSVWSVREVDARAVPGTRAPTCLIFESPEAVRRTWIFPPHWRELDDRSLWLIGERGPRLAAALATGKNELTSAIQRSMKNLYTARILVDQAKEIVSENVEARLQLADLLRRCRAERQAMHEAVEGQATVLRDAGIDVDEAATLFASAVQELGVELSADPGSVSQMLRDANRWCATAYRVA